MDDQLKQSALDFHEFPVPGKIQVSPTKPLATHARYLNQDLIVLVRCRKPVIFRVGICVGIGWCCKFEIATNTNEAKQIASTGKVPVYRIPAVPIDCNARCRL